MSEFTKITRGVLLVMAANLAVSTIAKGADGPLDYRVLATSRTSTMEKELNEAAADGFHFARAMGGKSANGGQETIAVMVRDAAGPDQPRKYKLLATTRTSTMQKELQRWADEGYEYKEQTVFETAFGGKEVVVIMELDPAAKQEPSSYKLLATTKTSTMQKELQAAGSQGYVLLGLTVSKTEIGGDEIVAVLRKN
jgi:hypothetical protein